MKKSLLFIAMCVVALSGTSQIVPSPSWPSQSANYSNVSTGTQWFDVVNDTVVWCLGYDGTMPNANFREFTRTVNGGTLYTSGFMYPDTNTYHPSSIEGINDTVCWVTSYLNTTQNKGAIHRTTDGGLNWINMTPVNMYTNTSSFGDFTAFSTPSIGITLGDPVAGEFEIHRTTNGGATWTLVPGASIPNPLGGEYGITDLYAKFGTNDIWFGTNLGRVYHSTNQGATWSVATVLASNYITKIAFRDAMNGIAYTNNATNKAYRTTNGGATWTVINPISPLMGLNDICNIPGTSWYASAGAGTGNNVISYSMDDGSTWYSWGGMNVQYLAVDFSSNTVGYAGGFSDPFTTGLDGMFKYNDVPLGIKNTAGGAPLATIELYPNPSNGNVTIDLQATKEGGTIYVLDAMGRTVYSENIKTVYFEKHDLNLTHLSKGIYSVNIDRAGRIETKKIVIE